MTPAQRRKLIREHLVGAIMGIVGDGGQHDSHDITAAVTPALRALLKKSDRTVTGKLTQSPIEAQARSWCSWVLRKMVREGVLIKVRSRAVRGIRTSVLQLPGGDATPSVSYDWRVTLEGFQRQARIYLDNKQFDKMGLV